MSSQADTIALIEEKARFSRAETVRLIPIAKVGHYASSFSCAEILATLYYGVMRLRRGEPDWPDRDRFLFGKGHAAAGALPAARRLGLLRQGRARRVHAARQPARRPPRHEPGAGHRLQLGLARPRALGRARHGARGPAGRPRRSTSSPCSATASCTRARCGRRRCRPRTIGARQPDRHRRPQRALARRQGRGRDGHRAARRQVAGLRLGVARGRRPRRAGAARPAAGASSPTTRAARLRVIIAHTVKGKGVSFMESELGWHLGYLAAEDEERALAEIGRGE